MSSAEVAARAVKNLEPEDLEVLKAVERSIPSYESVPLKRIQKNTTLHLDQVEFRLSKLNKLGFVTSDRFGTLLLTAGLDVLALNSLVKDGKISGMGKSIGMGKESDVFEVINDSGEQAVIKFYRIGRTSFRTTRKSRSYVDPKYQHQWLTINIRAAAREAEGLTRARNVGVTTPRFIARNRNAVLMQEVDGKMLHFCRREELLRPKALLNKVLYNTRLAYIRANMINGDLSEYNVLFDGEDPWIIDWPQFVTSVHKNASEMLNRDVENIVSFFRKKFELGIQSEKAVSYVKGVLSKI